jgi:hypothetical protein
MAKSAEKPDGAALAQFHGGENGALYRGATASLDDTRLVSSSG